MNKVLIIFGFLISFILSGCDQGVKSPRGFSLPEGNAENGKEVFLAMQCLACHSLDTVDDPDVEKDADIDVKLGGKVSRIKTYAELVTSIINPSHKLARGYDMSHIQEEGMSAMRNYNDIMTVTQLTDLVTFLQPHYELIKYNPTKYGPYSFH